MIQTKIIVIGIYFGKWPTWFPAFLHSCAKNASIDWLFFTDNAIPAYAPANTRFEAMNLNQLNQLASSKLGFPVTKDAYSICDLRPTYGILFDQYIKAYDFWGHCDFDVIWGDIRSFFTEEILQNYDMLWIQRQFLTGCFNLWKNTPKINELFMKIPVYQIALSMPSSTVFDDKIMTAYLTITTDLKIYKSKRLYACLKELDDYPFGWYWKNGNLYNRKHTAFICLHLAKWKKTMTHIGFNTNEQPYSFAITRRGIWKTLPVKERILERFAFDILLGAEGKDKLKKWIKKYII